MARSRLAPPSGAPPPTEAKTITGEVVALPQLAHAVCQRYRAEFPDEQERYGDAGQAWCVHDNQYILSWAFLDALGWIELGAEVAWLAGVLAARDFPLDRLARNLELCAAVVEETGRPWAADVAQRLRGCRVA